MEALCRIVGALHATSTMPTALQLVPTVSKPWGCFIRFIALLKSLSEMFGLIRVVDPQTFRHFADGVCSCAVCQYLAGADWRHRRAGLCALGALADSATKAFKVIYLARGVYHSATGSCLGYIDVIISNAWYTMIYSSVEFLCIPHSSVCHEPGYSRGAPQTKDASDAA